MLTGGLASLDVFEVLHHFVNYERAYNRNLIDPARIVLRGFSMGGAGTWHLGLHHPDQFCVPGAGSRFYHYAWLLEKSSQTAAGLSGIAAAYL